MKCLGRNTTSGLALFVAASFVLLLGLSGFDVVSHLGDLGKGAKNCPIYNASQHQYGTFPTFLSLSYTLLLEQLLPPSDGPLYHSVLLSGPSGRSPPAFPA